MRFIKKIFALALSIVLLICTIGCSQNEATSMVTNSETVSSYSHAVSETSSIYPSADELLSYGNSPDLSKVTMVTEFPEYSRKDKEINVIITNNNENDMFGYDPDVFYLERFENGKWKALPVKDSYTFLMVAYVLPGQTANHKNELSSRYKVPLKKGKYRIIIEELSAEFTVK